MKCADCNQEQERIISPTPPRIDTPVVTSVDRFDTLQLGFYRTASRGAGQPPATLRYRLSWERREIDIAMTDSPTGPVAQSSGHEQTFSFEGDTYLPIGGRGLWGTIAFARTSGSGTLDDRAQNEFLYIARPPGWSAGRVLLRADLAVGAITGRGANGLNLVNPSFEASWRHRPTKVNVRLVWSPQATKFGGDGWRTDHQIALVIDRVLYLKVFGKR